MGRLIEVELRVRDVDRSAAFYRMVGAPVGEPEVHGGEDVRHVHAGWGTWSREGSESYLLLNIYPADLGAEGRVSIGFVVDDLDAIHARLDREKVTVVEPPVRRPWGRMAVYRDPDGNTVSPTERPR